jgi:hypothetical protein
MANTHQHEEAIGIPGEHPSARIQALLARTRPLSGNEVREVYWEGRSLVESLALAYQTGTDCTWTLEQCATVLEFLATIEPTSGQCFCNDPSEVNATCGFHTLLEFMAEMIRAPRVEEVAHG